MSFLKLIGLKLLIAAISLYYGFVTMLQLMFNRFRFGPNYWDIKERTLSPLCLQDSSYGTHAYLNLKNIKLHYVENGDRSKPLMLFLHGFPEFWYSWRHQLKYFAKTHWCVALDMRGYGDSDKPSGLSQYTLPILEKDIVDTVHALGRKNCILVAHDWGGIIAWNVAANHPEVVEKLINLNGPHMYVFQKTIQSSWDQFRRSWYMFLFQLPYLPTIFRNANDLDAFRARFVNHKGESFVTDEDLEAYKYTFCQKDAWTPPLNYYRNVFRSNEIANPDYLKIPIIRCPTLVIWGENDLALSKILPEQTRQYVEDIQIKYIGNAGHFVQNDRPDEVNRLIESFV